MHSSTLLRRMVIVANTPLDLNDKISEYEDKGWKVIPESLVLVNTVNCMTYAVFIEKETTE